MMQGYGRHAGRGPLAGLDLTVEQQDRIAVIQEEVRRRNWSALGEMRSEMFKLRRMYAAEKLDPDAFAEQQKKVVRRSGPWWAGEGDG